MARSLLFVVFFEVIVLTFFVGGRISKVLAGVQLVVVLPLALNRLFRYVRAGRIRISNGKSS